MMLIKYRYGILFLLLSLMNINWIRAEDPFFSQYYASPLTLSPSLAGGTDGTRVVLNYRNQWPAISRTYQTYAFSMDKFFHTFNSGIGGFIMRDVAGDGHLATTNAAMQYAYNVILNGHWQFVPALQFGFGQKSIDFNKLNFADAGITDDISGSMGRFGNESVQYFDTGASFLFYSPQIWIGATYDHLTRPNITFLNEEMRIDPKLVIFGGYNFRFRQDADGGQTRSFSTSFRYMNQYDFQQLDWGVYWFNSPVEIGLWYRGLPLFDQVNNKINHDAIILLGSIKLGAFKFAYSYDITISQLASSGGGAHEVSIIYEFDQRIRVKGGSRPAVPCSDIKKDKYYWKYHKQPRRIM